MQHDPCLTVTCKYYTISHACECVRACNVQGVWLKFEGSNSAFKNHQASESLKP